MTTQLLTEGMLVAEKGFFARKLKELRAQAGLSQSELAKQADVPVGTIRGFEIGRREPTFVTLVKLAQGLNVSLSAFDPPPEEPDEPPAPKRPRKRR